MIKETETGTCCLCGEEYQHYGCNPYPLGDLFAGEKACHECDNQLVIPTRLTNMIRYGGTAGDLEENQRIRKEYFAAMLACPAINN